MPPPKYESVRALYELKGRNYIVTGGGQGIGFALTRAIAEMGGNVAVLDLRAEPVDDFNTLGSEYNVKTHYFQTDVAKEESLIGGFERALEALGGRLDGLIPCAGIAVDKPFVEQGWGEVEKLLQVNVLGTFFACQLATKQMLKQGTGGSLVLISSVNAHNASPGHKLSGYAASKGGVLMMMKALAVELAPHQIRVNSISPGYIDSDLTQRLRQELPHLIDIMEQVPPMKRIGNPNDLTGAAIYLLSEASKYTTGADILITGGWHAGRIEANSVKT